MTRRTICFLLLAWTARAEEPALKGYDPVAYFTRGEATRGDAGITLAFGGQTIRFATEAHRASTAFAFGAKMASMLIEAMVYTVLAALVSWKATLIALGGGVFIVVILRQLVHKNRKAGAKQTVHMQSLIAQMTDVLISIKPLKAMARERQSDEVLTGTTRRLNRALQKQVLSKAALGSFQEPLTIVFLVLCLYIALTYWNLSLTAIIAMVFFIGKTLKQIEKIQKEYVNLVEYDSAYWSLLEKIQGAQAARETFTGTLQPSFSREIRMEDVSFAYGDRVVLDRVSLTLPAGSFSALLGPSGSGKSTLTDLLTGLLRPQKGDIWIDAAPLSRIDIGSWRAMIGYVPQENLLMHDTVLRNVTLGEDAIGEADVEAALRAADAWDFVQGLPQGIHSVVGERGSMISGGQRQRIAIARALLMNPRILIMDDSTSSVDAETEYKIQAALEELMKGRTTFVIAQRISTVRSADKILLMDQGKLVAQGTHNELLSCCELYAEIIESQLGGHGDLVSAVEEAVK